MTTQLNPPAAATTPAALPRVPFTRLGAVELRKMLDTRAGKWLLIAIAIVTVLVIVIYLAAAHQGDLTYERFVDATSTPQGLLLPVLGILAITSEWSQRTGLVTFTLEPNRSRVVWAKFAALVVLGLAAAALALLLALPANALGEALRNGSGSWTFGASGVGDAVILQLIGLIQGFAFGMLFMNSAAAIVLYFVIPIALNIVFALVPWLQTNIAPWFNLSALKTHVEPGNSMNPSDWRNLVIAVAIWVVLPFVIGLLRLLRSELKSS